jgi:hypothetical protein
MGGKCSTDGEDRKLVQIFFWKTSAEELYQKNGSNDLV